MKKISKKLFLAAMTVVFHNSLRVDGQRIHRPVRKYQTVKDSVAGAIFYRSVRVKSVVKSVVTSTRERDRHLLLALDSVSQAPGIWATL